MLRDGLVSLFPQSRRTLRTSGTADPIKQIDDKAIAAMIK